jgi:iron-sulfur cluster repair protein YtfE (RIC family)
MLIQIGSSKESAGITDLLLECHQRIRYFLSLASRLAQIAAPSHDEITDAAGRITRYFSEALPLHVADEEETVVPRLSGRTAQLDAALQGMHDEHLEHEPQISTLVEMSRTLQTSPEKLEELRHSLLTTASKLEKELTAHLEQEEQIVLPAISVWLSQEEQVTMLNELRARRDVH